MKRLFKWSETLLVLQNESDNRHDHDRLNRAKRRSILYCQVLGSILRSLAIARDCGFFTLSLRRLDKIDTTKWQILFCNITRNKQRQIKVLLSSLHLNTVVFVLNSQVNAYCTWRVGGFWEWNGLWVKLTQAIETIFKVISQNWAKCSVWYTVVQNLTWTLINTLFDTNKLITVHDFFYFYCIVSSFNSWIRGNHLINLFKVLSFFF